MTKNRIALPMAAIVLLAACGSSEGESGTTSAEEQQLDNAAAALDEAQADYEAAIQTPDAETAAETEDEAEH
jgi:major membrane immunogen (membrane-anchored lipoprotein)